MKESDKLLWKEGGGGLTVECCDAKYHRLISRCIQVVWRIFLFSCLLGIRQTHGYKRVKFERGVFLLLHREQNLLVGLYLLELKSQQS